MPRNPEPYHYNIETLSHLSGWAPNRIYQDVHREGLNVGHLREAVLWLASNGAPELRAEMSKRLIPVVLGTRRTEDGDKSLDFQASSYDLLLEVFKQDRAIRDQRATKIKRKKREKDENESDT